MDKNTVAIIFRALGDENRLNILEMLSSGEKCACKLLERFDITQPTLSHHMKTLSDCGLVNTRKEGKWSYYSLNCDLFFEVENYISVLTSKQSKEKCGCK